MRVLTIHGVKVPLASTDVSADVWLALSGSTYEAKEARWVRRAVRPHDRVLELGTGIGILTCLIAGIEGVHVWTFEPNPSSVRLAQRVIEANDLHNITLSQGILAAGSPHELLLYLRKDLWMSSLFEHQGPYYGTLPVRSENIDEFLVQHQINVVVMDIEGAERELLMQADFPGVERIFLELHDHLYGLAGIRDITSAMAAKGFGYDSRGSSGACVLLSRGDEPRMYQPEQQAEV